MSDSNPPERPQVYSRRDFSGLVGRAGLAPMLGPSVLRNPDQLTVNERFNIYRSLDIFNPKLYTDDKNVRDIAFKDITEKHLTGSDEIIISGLYHLLHLPLGEKIAKKQALSEAEGKAAEVIVKIAHLYLSNITHQKGRDLSNELLLNRTEQLVSYLALNFVNHPDNTINNGGLWKRVGTEADTLLKFFTLSPAEITQLKKTSLDSLQNALTSGRIKPSTMTDFIMDLDSFSDPRGELAIHLLADKIVSRAKALNVSDTAEELLTPQDELELQLMPQIAAHTSSPQVWQKKDWESYQNYFKDAAKLDHFSQACALINRRKTAWADFANGNLDRPELKPEVQDGIDIYGLSKPLTEEDLKTIFINSAGDLFKTGGMPSIDQMGKFRKEQIKDNIRQVEFFLSQQAYTSLETQLRPFNVTVAQWLNAHIIESNDMLEETRPLNDVRVKLNRIVIVPDEIIAKRANTLKGFYRGSARPDYFFIHPDEDRYPPVDNLSPWSLDSHGRWVITEPYDLRKLYYLKTINGRDLPVDGGMTHEIAHQILDMRDLYVYETMGAPGGERLYDFFSPEVQKEFKLTYFINDKGQYLPMGHFKTPTYPWPETAYMLWLATKEGDYFKTQFPPFKKRFDLQPAYEFLSGRSLSFTWNNEVSGAVLAPLGPSGSEPKAISLSGRSGSIPGRFLGEKVLHKHRGGGNYLLKTTLPEGIISIPIPTFVLQAGNYLADLEGKPDIKFDIQIRNIPKHQFDLVELRFITREDLEETRARLGSKLYAEMGFKYKNEDYFVLWSTNK